MERSVYLTTDYVVGKLADTVEGRFNLCPEKGVGRQMRAPQPIVTHHPFLVRVGDGASFELLHGQERLLEPWLHLLHEIIAETNPAHVQQQPQLLVLVQPLQVPIPQLEGILLQTLHPVLIDALSPRQFRRDVSSDRQWSEK